MTEALPAWRLADGSAVTCREKLALLAETEAELSRALQDSFEDAVLMGVDAEQARARLAALVERLESPLRVSARDSGRGSA